MLQQENLAARLNWRLDGRDDRIRKEIFLSAHWGKFQCPSQCPKPPLVSRPFCCVREVQVGHAGKMACSSKQGFSPFSPISTSDLVLILNIHLTWTLNFNTNVSLSYFFPVYWLLAVLSPEDLMPTFLKLVMAHNPHVR